jgi:putative hemolysin
MFEIVIIFFLTVLNGLLAMSELAVVSTRRARLQAQIEMGSKTARTALELSENPNRFLSTVQIGISLIGILAGAFGGATVADDLSRQLEKIDFLTPYSDIFGFVLIVLLTTYLSLVIGELVPKRLAMVNPERVASLVAPVMRVMSLLAYPLVWFLSLSTEAVLRLLGVDASETPPVSEEEINIMLGEGEEAGVFEAAERRMVEGVFRLNDLRVDALMTPRTEMLWLDIQASHDELATRIADGYHTRYPICDGQPDHLLGIVRTKDILRLALTGSPLKLEPIVRRVVEVPYNLPASDLLEVFRGKEDHFAVVIGEHGGVDGVITMNDLVEAVMGDIDEPDYVQRDDGSWLIDGLMPVEEVKDLLDIKAMPDESDYQTLGGFVIYQLGRVPQAADRFEWQGLWFEVIDMDGHRVDKVLVSRM